MLNIEKIIGLLFEKFEETPRGIIVIFCLSLIGIALVVDTMLTFTYPAYTLIAVIILSGAFSTKTYEKYKRNKFYKIFDENHSDNP